jgi:Fic family protein
MATLNPICYFEEHPMTAETPKSTKDAAIQRADTLKTELDAQRPLAPDVEGSVLQKLKLWWNYNSNAIEGNRYTLGETEIAIMHGLTAQAKPLKDYLDIEGHQEAVHYLSEVVRQQEILTEASIRKLHELLLVKPYEVDAETPDGKPSRKLIQPGRYKTEPNHVRTRTGEIHYYASPMETPALMQDLVTWYRTELNGAKHPIEVAASFHHRFTAIHPFDDGNGRLGRILMNLLLMQRGYPPAVIQVSQRDDYLLALQAADNGNLDPIIEILANAVIVSLDVYTRAARGERIHDLQDLTHEIALFKQSLRHIPEPMVLTSELQRSFFRQSIDPLFSQTVAVLLQLRDMFRESFMVANYQWRRPKVTSSGQVKEMLAPNLILSDLPLAQYMQDDSIISSLKIAFMLRGFTRGQLKVFDVNSHLNFDFKETLYQINWGTGADNMSRLYDQPLTKDDINTVTESIGRRTLNTIRQQLKT